MLPYLPDWLAHTSFIKIRQQILKNGKFALLKNDEDRIKFTADGLIKYGWEMEDCPNEEKSSAISEKYRNEGNAAFTSDPSTSSALESAYELYSKGVAYAVPGSRELSLAYANRSAVLFKAHRYEECLLDIDRALRTGYVDDLKPKLLIRKAKAIYALTGNISADIDDTLAEVRSLIEKLPSKSKHRQALEDILNDPDSISSVGKFREKELLLNYTPQLEKQNPELPGASDAIKLEFSGRYGRHVIATRDIKSGEILMLQKPYVTIVEIESWYNLCAYCGKQSWSGIPCDYCVSVLYCTDRCKQAAWSEYHDIECQIRGRMKELNVHSVMGLRLTIKALREAGSFEKLKQYLNELDSLKEQGLDVPLDPESYSMIYTMLDNTDNKTPEEMLHWASNAVEITYSLATRTEMFDGNFPPDLSIVKDAEWFTFAAALLSKNMRIGKTRANLISSKSDNSEREQGVATLVPLYTYFNHSCCSPIALFSFSDVMALITPIPIKEGDQIFTCYGPYFMRMEKESRAEVLKTDFHFVCNCPACRYDWSPSTCTLDADQELPLEVKNKLEENKTLLAKYSDGVANCENFNVVTFIEEICAIIDTTYSHVQHPYFTIEHLIQLLHGMFSAISHLYTPLKK